MHYDGSMNKIKTLRTGRKLTRWGLSKALLLPPYNFDAPPYKIARWEAGQELKAADAVALAAYFEVAVDEVLS